MPNDRIVIVGGGVIGSSIAHHVCQRGGNGTVTTVERDPSCQHASSFLSMGGIRQQFSSPANVRLAQYSTRFYRRFDDDLRSQAYEPRVHFNQRGYLFLVDDALADRFEQRYVRQRELGVRIERLSIDASTASCQTSNWTTSGLASLVRTTAT